MSSKVVSDGGKVIALEHHTKKLVRNPKQQKATLFMGRANLVLIDVTLSTRAKYRLARCWSENVNK
jgi:hypothetical protein